MPSRPSSLDTEVEERKKEKQHMKDTMTEEQSQTLHEGQRGHPLEAMLLLAMVTGIRRSTMSISDRYRCPGGCAVSGKVLRVAQSGQQQGVHRTFRRQ